MRRLTPLLVLAALSCAEQPTSAPADGASFARIHEAEGSHGGTPMIAVLEPGTEVPNPPGGDPGLAPRGIAVVTLNSGQEEICFKTTFEGLSSTVSDAHIHRGAAGVRGPVVVPFAAPVAELFPAVSAGTVARCVPASRALIKEIRENPEGFYVNIHTRNTGSVPEVGRPGGAIRGQLAPTQGSTVNQF